MSEIFSNHFLDIWIDLGFTFILITIGDLIVVNYEKIIIVKVYITYSMIFFVEY